MKSCSVIKFLDENVIMNNKDCKCEKIIKNSKYLDSQAAKLSRQIIKSNNNKKSFKQFESIQKLLNAENKLERIMARLAFSNAKAIDIKHKIQ